MPDKKICATCKEEKDLTEENFYTKWNRTKTGRWWDFECRDCHNDRTKRTRLRLISERRQIVFDHYGGKCSCCGEDNWKFLTIDHINNDGAEHRNKIGKGSRPTTPMWYGWIIDNDFPDHLRLQCYNCNCGRQFNAENKGICPHEEERTNV